MRFSVLPNVALLAVSLFVAGAVPHGAFAQANPTAEQIVKALTPNGADGETRGIRIGSKTQQPAPAAKPSTSLNVLFATGSAELTPSAMNTLDSLGKALTDNRLSGNHFRIEGHTDTVGTPEQNKALSERRAQSVASYLGSKYALGADRIEAVGMGEDGLQVPTPAQTPEARNRRVVVVNLGS